MIGDPILTARLDALKQYLKHAEKPSSWREKLNLQHVEVVDEEIWTGLDMTIGKQVETLLKHLQNIHGKQDLREAWQDYAKAYEHSQEIFRECLEFLGGLAFRDKLLDESICEVSDELIRNCKSTILGPPSLTVPAPQGALTKTLGRIIRLRFPEWTIWTLPFTAHEYGHVVVDEVEALKKFVEEEVTPWVSQYRKSQRLSEYGEERAKKRAKAHLHVLLADAFATYTMGPAYAYAAFLLRFNPSDAYADCDKHPADAKRVLVVFGMLNRMNEEAQGVSPPYRDVIEHLGKEWERMLERAGPSGGLEASDKTFLNDLVDDVLKKFKDAFVDQAQYRHTGEDGWHIARQWGEIWQGQLKKGEFLPIPEVSRTSKLRDALNAAWLCRIANPNKIEEIAGAARELCKKIIDEQRKPQRQRARGSGRGERGPSTQRAPAPRP